MLDTNTRITVFDRDEHRTIPKRLGRFPNKASERTGFIHEEHAMRRVWIHEAAKIEPP
jgi:hypothetical protein